MGCLHCMGREKTVEREKTNYVPQPDFSDVTPKMTVREEKSDALYEKAFYSHEEVNDSEYCQNTTTWD